MIHSPVDWPIGHSRHLALVNCEAVSAAVCISLYYDIFNTFRKVTEAVWLRNGQFTKNFSEGLVRKCLDLETIVLSEINLTQGNIKPFIYCEEPKMYIVRTTK